MNSKYINDAKNASLEVVKRYVQVMALIVAEPSKIPGITVVKNKALKELRNYIEAEREAYDKIPDEDILNYMEEFQDVPDKVTIVDCRPFYHLRLKGKMVEHPEFTFNGRSLYDVLKAKEIIDELKDSFENNQSALGNGSISKQEYDSLDTARIVSMILLLSKSPLAEEHALDVDLDISKLNRITIEDIDKEFGTGFSESEETFSYMSLKRLENLIECFEEHVKNYKHDKDFMYIEAQHLISYISRFNSSISSLNEDDLDKFGEMLNGVNDNTKKHPAYSKIKELYNKRKKDYM